MTKIQDLCGFYTITQSSTVKKQLRIYIKKQEQNERRAKKGIHTRKRYGV